MTTPLPLTQGLHEWAEIFMRRSMRDFAEFSRQSGLSISQLNALMRIRHEGTCGVSDLGDHLGVTSAAASQMIDRLVQMGYLTRGEDPLDRRVKSLRLTESGKALIGEAIDARRRWMEALTEVFTSAQQQAIVSALVLLTEAARNLERDHPQPENPHRGHHAGPNPLIKEQLI
jgi:DNA-binding MarR family transcriptional regulator